MQPDTTITVINRYVSGHEDKYKATIIRGVHWHGGIMTGLSAEGLTAANTYTIRIPAAAPDDKYIPSYEWSGSNHNGWTLQSGDYIVKGIFSAGTISSSVIRSCTLPVIAVKGYTENLRGAAPHYKVVGA